MNAHEMLIKASLSITPLLNGCPQCEYDKSELHRHCEDCMENITREAFIIFCEVNHYLYGEKVQKKLRRDTYT